VKATRLKGIKDFKAAQFGLHPIALDTWGHFVFLHLQGGKPAAAAAAAGQGLQEQQQDVPGVSEWLGKFTAMHVCVTWWYSVQAAYSLQRHTLHTRHCNGGGGVCVVVVAGGIHYTCQGSCAHSENLSSAES
jgi:hypothetical protein